MPAGGDSGGCPQCGGSLTQHQHQLGGEQADGGLSQAAGRAPQRVQVPGAAVGAHCRDRGRALVTAWLGTGDTGVAGVRGGVTGAVRRSGSAGVIKAVRWHKAPGPHWHQGGTSARAIWAPGDIPGDIGMSKVAREHASTTVTSTPEPCGHWEHTSTRGHMRYPSDAVLGGVTQALGTHKRQGPR